MDYSDLPQLLDELIAFGEDAEELNYWRDVFADLPEDKQQEMYQLFKQELEDLKNA